MADHRGSRLVTPATACPSDDTVARFVDGSLSAAEDRAMRAHLDTCPDCRRLVADVGAGRSGPFPSLREPTPPTRVAERDDLVGPGAMIASKYRVLRVIGMGGMGKVVAALHVELNQTVAIKVMHPEMATETDSVRRFMREGKSAALLRSDHAVRIIDVGRLPSGVPYLVMEYLEGEDLDARRARRQLSVEEIVDYMAQAMTAIAEAHDAGLVHRDIKPQNLFLMRLPDGRERVKVLDFGLAKELPSIQSTNSALTTDNMLLGSPHYMSPEQIRTPTSVDGRTDIWALGAAMFKLLTGQPPYVSGTLHGVLARILADPAPHVRSLRPDVSPALDEVIARCMEKDLEKRFQSVHALLDAMLAAVPLPSASMVKQRAAPPTMVDVPPTRFDQDEVTVARDKPSAPLEATVDDSRAMVPVEGEAARQRSTDLLPPKRPVVRAGPTLVSAPPLAPLSPLAAPAVAYAPAPSVRGGSRRSWTVAFVVVTVAATIIMVLVVRASRLPAHVGSPASGSVTVVQLPGASSTSSASIASSASNVPSVPATPSGSSAPATPVAPEISAVASVEPPRTPGSAVHAGSRPPASAVPITKKPSKPTTVPTNDPLYGWEK